LASWAVARPGKTFGAIIFGAIDIVHRHVLRQVSRGCSRGVTTRFALVTPST